MDRMGQVIELSDAELTVGREPGCGLELHDDSVSRRHALLQPGGEGYVVVDLGSTNGTYVNDTRIETRALEPSDRLRFGNQIFKYLAADRFETEYFENAYRMMTTDGLTEAYNKRYLFDMCERELRRSQRTGRPLSVLMIDIDRFKSINDTFGHLAGDEVLIELSRRLRSKLRGDEVLARYGGEEFCLLLPETSHGDAIRAAERLRAVVADARFNTQHANVSMTVSIGTACSQATLDVSASDLIEQADKQLYAAKRAGRNRVEG
jgi:diguanylate cyclase (GGDEF)-like protein